MAAFTILVFYYSFNLFGKVSYAIAYVWKSEDHFVDLVLSYLNMGSRDQSCEATITCSAILLTLDSGPASPGLTSSHLVSSGFLLPYMFETKIQLPNVV